MHYITLHTCGLLGADELPQALGEEFNSHSIGHAEVTGNRGGSSRGGGLL